MSTWNNVPYSYFPGSARLLGPTNTYSPPPGLTNNAYSFQATSGMVQDATMYNRNNSYFLARYGSTPPSIPPSVPTLLYATSTNIAVAFNNILVSGTLPITYSIAYSTDPNVPAGGTTIVQPAVEVSQGVYNATVSGLTASTPYYFRSLAINDAGEQVSAVSAPFTTTSGANAPNVAPSVPESVSVGTTNAVIQFFAIGVTGAAPLNYSFLYGTSDPPTIPAPATKVLPSLEVYTNNFTGLLPNTTYYFRSVVTNSVGQQVSASSLPIMTGGGSDTPPTGTVGIPTLVTTATTATSITVRYSVAAVVGSNLTHSGLWGPTSPTVKVSTTQLTPDIYEFTVNGLTPSTDYVFAGFVSNTAGSLTSVTSPPYTTAAAPPPPNLVTNAVIPFLIQGPRFGDSSPWAGIDYYINVSAVGATANVGTTNTQGQQLFASMYAGTVGDPGNVTGTTPPCPYAGSCIADQPFQVLDPFAGNPGNDYSDTYLQGIQSTMGSNGRMLACWGGFLADVRGLFGPFTPTGFPGNMPSSKDVVESFLFNYMDFYTGGVPNTLNWVRRNSQSNSAYNFVFNGLVLDFENIGYGNPQNNYPYAPPATLPSFPADATNPQYAPYITQIGAIPGYFRQYAANAFLANAPASLSIVADVGTTNVCAPNTALNTYYAFPTATVAPTLATYNGDMTSLALNAPSNMALFDDIFVQFYNEDQDYYLGGKYFTNLLACWGLAALQAQKAVPSIYRSVKINIGLATGNIIPGKNNAGIYVADGQGPTPPIGSGPPYTYWYPQYATVSPPNATTPAQISPNWPNTSPSLDPVNLAAAITGANNILRAALTNNSLQPSDWCSGAGFWAGGDGTIKADLIYDKTSSFSPGSVLPAINTYCWSDATYPAPNPRWDILPITTNF